tara:strand:- start:236 stop:697 length:462 start_codon:yes stop_codon:yes gene_type:complete
MYPHQVLMEEQNLQKDLLSKEAQNYLKDFNHFHRGVSLKQSRAEKKGKEFEVPESDTQKLIRLSKSVCVQIYEDMNTTRQEAEYKKKQEAKIQEEALELKRIQEQEDLRIKEELEQKKKEEEDREKEEEEEGLKTPPPAAPKEEGGSLFDYFF